MSNTNLNMTFDANNVKPLSEGATPMPFNGWMVVMITEAEVKPVKNSTTGAYYLE